MSLFLFFAFSFPAEAKKASVCMPAEEISNRIESCEENSLFLKLAKDCASRLELSVKASAAGLSQGFASKPASGKQAADLHKAASNYATSSLTLAELAATHALAAKEVHAYRDSVIIPEDADNPDVSGGNAQAFADSIPCYGETRSGLEKISQDLSARAAQLSAAQKATEAGEAASSQGEQNLNGSLGGNLVTRKVAKPVSGKTGQSSPQNSSISGIEEQKAREK